MMENAKEGYQGLGSSIDKAELTLEVQSWARKIHELDQAWRKSWPSQEEFKMLEAKMTELNLPRARWEEFLDTNQDLNLEWARIELSQFLERMSVPNRDAENQVSLRQLFDKIDGFPGRFEYGKDSAITAFDVLQHSDNDREFQKEGLKLMYDCHFKNKPETSVELVYFYYLTDRITMGLYGYQFFGTQNNGANLIALPNQVGANFKNNPALFCTKLTEREFPEELRVTPSNQEMHSLWELADQDKLDSEGQNSAIPEFLEKYK